MKRIIESTTAEEVRETMAAPEGVDHLSDDELALASEIAFRAADHASAILATEALARRRPQDIDLVFRLAILRSQTGHDTRAEEHCLDVLGRAPRFVAAHQLLISLRLRRGDIEGAIDAALAQERECGSEPGLCLQIASLLGSLGRADEAIKFVHAINDAGSPSETSLMLEAELSLRLGQPDTAVIVAERARRLWPDSAAICLYLARLLYSTARFDRAIPVLRQARTLAAEDGELAFMLGTALFQVGDRRGAMEEVLAAIALDPSRHEYCYYAAILADLFGEHALSIELMQQASELTPSADTHVALANLLGKSGNYERAVQALDRAEALTSEKTAIRQLRLSLLATADGMPVPALASATTSARALPRATMRRPRTFAEGLRVQLRVLSALVMRELKNRTVYSRLGIASVLMPQAIQILTLGAVLSLFNSGRPPLGEHLFFFYATGVMPFYIFIHVVDHSQNVFIEGIPLLQIPLLTRLDLMLSIALAELLIGLVSVTVTFSIFAALDYGPSSDNQIEALFSLLTIWAFALGLGLICAVMNNLYRPWAQGWVICQRFLYVASGIFYIPQNMPGWIRDFLVWNPLVQCIEWFRTAFFQQYQPPWLDKQYAVGVAFAFVVGGLALERALRRRMLAQ